MSLSINDPWLRKQLDQNRAPCELSGSGQCRACQSEYDIGIRVHVPWTQINIHCPFCGAILGEVKRVQAGETGASEGGKSGVHDQSETRSS